MERLVEFKDIKITKKYEIFRVVIKHDFTRYGEKIFDEKGEENEALSIVIDRVLQRFDEENAIYQAKNDTYNEQKVKLEGLGLGPLEFNVEKIIYESSPEQYETKGIMTLGYATEEDTVNTWEVNDLEMVLCDRIYTKMFTL